MDRLLDIGNVPGIIEFDIADLEKACQCNVDAYRDYPLYPALFGSLAGPDITYKNWYASIRAIYGKAMMVADSRQPIKSPKSPSRSSIYAFFSLSWGTLAFSSSLPKVRFWGIST